MATKENFEDKIFFSKYKPEKKIGEGSFGKIYSGILSLTQQSTLTLMKNLLSNL
jgi:hypothetical protein